MNRPDPPEFESIAVGQVWTRLVQAGPQQASEAVVFLHGNPGSAGDFVPLVTGELPFVKIYDELPKALVKLAREL